MKWLGAILVAAGFVLLMAVAAHSAEREEIAIGDSIAVGLELPGSAKVGLSPKAVVQRIAAMPVNDLYGHVVILSTGLSNDPKDFANVVLQLEMLRAAGAAVVLLGVGAEMKGSLEINQWLRAQAQSRDWVYIDGWQKVHPENYRALRDLIREYECHARWLCNA